MLYKRVLDRIKAGGKRRGIERSVASGLAIFRLASWGLTSLLYISSPAPSDAFSFKVAVAGTLLVAALLSIWLLNRAAGDTRGIAGLTLAEALVLPEVLVPTGGVASPFVWYALNPLLVAAVYLPMGYTWGVVGTFLAASFAATAVSPLTNGVALAEYAQVALILVLVTLTTRLQARLLRTLETQSAKIGRQSDALREAYDSLTVKGESLSALLEFQHEAISCLGHPALYRVLTERIQARFAAAGAAVLYVPFDAARSRTDPPRPPDEPGLALVEAGGPGRFDWQETWSLGQRLTREDKAAELQGDGQGEDLGLTVAPLLVADGNLAALLIVRGLAESRRTELAVWLEYARQLAARIAAADRTQHTLDYLSDVYQLVEGAGISHDETDLLELITLYAKQLTGAEKAAYWAADEDDPETLRPLPSIIRGRKEGILAEDFTEQVSEWWASANTGLAVRDRYDAGHTLWHACYSVVRSSNDRFGVLFVLSSRPFSLDFDVSRTMGFLGYLAGAMLERRRAEDVHGRLLVSEEKSRIAAEIHDGASQGLFSLVYGLQGAIRTLDAGGADEARRKLVALRSVAADVSGEIRTAIFQLSKVEEKSVFVQAVEGYLADLAEVYGLETDIAVTGSEDNLSPALRRAVYRIVREAASNAARHSQGGKIAVKMSLRPQQTVVEIEDDGQGFIPPVPATLADGPAPGRSGLGLLNMNQLARSFNGALEVDSALGRGTRIVVKIPELAREEGGTVEVAASR